MDERKKKILMGCVVGATIIGLIVLIVVLTRSASCELVESKPEFPDESKMKVVKAKDGSALAEFGSYIKYTKAPSSNGAEDPKTNNKIFLDLTTDSIALSKVTDGRLLEIGTDCAKLKLALKQDNQKTVYVDTIQVDWKLANGQTQSCTVSSLKDSIFATDKHHYYCNNEMEYDCIATTKDDKSGKETQEKIASLVMHFFEFEVDGIDAAKFKAGEFTTQKTECRKK